MQNPKWVIGLASAFILLTIVSNILEGVWGMEATRLQVLFGFNFWPPSQAVAWIKNLWGILSFDYSFFYGGYAIFRWAVFFPISVGLVVALGIELFLRLRIPFLSN